MKHKEGNRQVLVKEATLLGIVVVSLLAAVNVSGQLLSDLGQPVYYLDQVSANELEPQDSIAYWALNNQLQPQSSPKSIEDALLSYRSQSPTVNEIMLNEQLLERLNGLRQATRGDLPDNRALIADLLAGSIKQEDRSAAEGEQDKISGPINDPLEFEATAKLLEQLPSALTNNNSSPSDLVSLDTFLSGFLSNLVKELETTPTSEANISHNIAEQEDSTTKTSSKSIQQERRHQQEDTTPASRYGSAEYIDHPLAIIGHQYVQGGAGEGKQLLGPEGTFENVQVVKSDHAVPSYCDPPNPCPIGFTAEDGCLENFVNSASSSREYQAKQQCSCDNEHSLFNCASPISTLREDLLSTPTTSSANNEEQIDDEDNRIDSNANGGRLETLARTIENRFGSLSSIQNLISRHDDHQDDISNSLLD